MPVFQSPEEAARRKTRKVKRRLGQFLYHMKRNVKAAEPDDADSLATLMAEMRDSLKTACNAL